MTEEQDHTGRAVELLVLAPIGLATFVRELAPTVTAMLVNRGRNEVEHRQQQLRTLKSTGEVAIAFGVPMVREKINQRITNLRGGSTTPAPSPAAAPTTTASTTSATTGTNANAAEQSTDEVLDLTRSAPASAGVSYPGSDLLAIPGYDTLSASQVVDRLAGLGSDDLEAIRLYEEANRKRRTILGKIEQLSSDLSA